MYRNFTLNLANAAKSLINSTNRFLINFRTRARNTKTTNIRTGCKEVKMSMHCRSMPSFLPGPLGIPTKI